MPADEYDAWAQRHAAAFGLRSEEDARSLLVWTDQFRRGGVTALELTQATDWLALNDPPKWISEHLGALRLCIDRQRRQRANLSPEVAPDLGTCVLCFNAGMVCVPNLKAMALGQWASQAVLCRCALGNWVGNRQHGNRSDGSMRPPLMTLDEYESRCPNWRALAGQHEGDCIRALRERYGRVPNSDAYEGLISRLLERIRDG